MQHSSLLALKQEKAKEINTDLTNMQVSVRRSCSSCNRPSVIQPRHNTTHHKIFWFQNDQVCEGRFTSGLLNVTTGEPQASVIHFICKQSWS